MSKQVNTTYNAPVVGDVYGGAVNVSNTTVNNYQHMHQHDHVHQHTHTHTVHAHGPVVIQAVVPPPAFALQASPAPPARQGLHKHPKPPKRDLTPAQSECLALMRPLPKPVRVDVLIWMRIEFGTSLVMDLDPRELHRLRGYLAEVRRAVGGGLVYEF